jgi:predicted metal-binding protein
MTMPMNIHPKYITNDDGEKLSVVLSIEEFEEILEDYEDLAIVAQRKDDKLTSHEDFLEELKQDGTI